LIRRGVDGVVRRNVLDGPIGKNRPQALEEVVPLALAVKVIDHQEAAAQQMLPHSTRLVFAERPVTDLDGIQPRVVEQLVAVRAHDVTVRMDVDARQPLDRLREVDLRGGIIGIPAAVAATSAAVIREARERPFLRLAD